MARDFDGSDDICYRTGSEAAFEFTTSESYTLACWVRHDSLTGYQRYITKGVAGSADSYFLGKAGTTNVLDFGVGVAAPYLVGTTALSANTWYFAAIVRDVGADQFRLYLATAPGDVGLEFSTADISTGTHGTVATGLGIGRPTPDLSEPMNGRIAEVSIWNRALMLNELRALKWGGLKDKAGLLAYWPLWGVAAPEPDLSGNGRHLDVFEAARAGHAPVGPYAPVPAFTQVKVAVQTFVHSVGGALSPAGALIKSPSRTFGGVLAPAGSLVRSVGKSMGGVIAPAGSLVRRVSQALGGVISPVGTMTKRLTLVLSGAISPVGSVLAQLAGPARNLVLKIVGPLLKWRMGPPRGD